MLCPNCKETIADQSLICPFCKESISEPVTFHKRSIQINKEAIQIYDELSQEEKKENDYLQTYKRNIYKQAKSLNLNNEQKEDVLEIFGKDVPKKPCVVFELILTIFAGAIILLLFANHNYGISIPYGVSINYLIYAIIGLSGLTTLLLFGKIIKKRKKTLLVLFILLHILILGSIIYLHFIAQTI